VSPIINRRQEVYRNRQPKNCQFSGIAGIVDVKAMPINSVSMSETIWRRTHVDEFPWLFERKFRVSCQKAPRSHRLVGEGVSWKLSDRGGYEPTHGRGVLITRRSQDRVLPLLNFVYEAPLGEWLRRIWPPENRRDPQVQCQIANALLVTILGRKNAFFK